MTRSRTLAFVIVVALTAMALTQAAVAGRYEQFTEKASKGPHMTVEAATFFGSDDPEEFVAVDRIGKHIVAFGNAWGPDFPSDPKPMVIGDGRHRGLETYGKDRKGRKTLPRENPDVAGFAVFYKSGLAGIEKILKFDWGVASIETGVVATDGKGLLITGRCTPAFVDLARKCDEFHTVDQPEGSKRRRGPKYGPYRYDGVTVPGDVYLARLSPDGKIEWAWILKGHRTPPSKLWQDKQGTVYFELNGFTRVAPNGSKLQKLRERGSGGRVGVRAVDPEGGHYYLGGDRNTNTGREPWRQPFLYKYNLKGEKVWTAWEWNSRRVGSDKYRLVSDSAARCGTIAPNGDVIIGGWSDGGNSVFTRQPHDLDKSSGGSRYGTSSWGMKNANSLGYLLRLDPKTREQKAWALWVSYVPQDFNAPRYRNAPNGANLRQIECLSDDAIAFTGTSGTGLIQTPNAFFKYPKDGEKHGGWYVTVFNKDLTHLLFSSYLPGCKELAIAPVGSGLAVVSRSENDGGRMGKSPTRQAVQKDFGGAYDGHIVLLSMPDETSSR